MKRSDEPKRRKSPSGQPKTTRKSWLTSSTQRRIAREAAALGIPPQKYLKLVLTVSESLRASLGADQKLDLSVISQWMDSPLWPVMVEWIVKTAGSMLKQSGGDASVDAKTKQEDSAQVQPTGPSSSRGARNSQPPPREVPPGYGPPRQTHPYYVIPDYVLPGPDMSPLPVPHSGPHSEQNPRPQNANRDKLATPNPTLWHDPYFTPW